MASWIIIIILATALTAVFMIFKPSQHKKHKIKQVLPPGPKGLPILGCLHMLGDLPHQDLHKLSQKYGPIMHIRLGSVPTIVASSSEAAELFLKTHDLVFASRPYIQATKNLSYRRKELVFTEYGSYWRDIRKLCSLELLTNSKIETFRPMRKEEVGKLVEVLKGAADARKAVCLSEMVEKVVEDMSYRMVFGCKDDRFHFRSIISEAFEIVGASNVGDYVPFLAPVLFGVYKKFDEFLERLIEEHLRDAKDKQTQLIVRDFIDVMLSLIA
ncbi:hypothetical protein Sjap_024406 [Stephania japonica]|uniref:Cytochrome P450 n=1 Tax=Stephania japonica TaxID=461633 RepID=A0AAP0HLG4_9MAGN